MKALSNISRHHCCLLFKKHSLVSDFGDDGHGEVGLHRVVHERVWLDEVYGYVGQSPGVVDARTRSGLGDFLWQHSEPVAVYVLLLLERALEDLEHVGHGEGANGRAADRVHGGGEDAVDQLRVSVAVYAFGDFARRFCNELKN